MSEKKVVLITGASSGIGQQTAQRLARAGHIVFGTSRSATDQTRTNEFKLLPLDVRSEKSVRDCVETVAAHAGRLDVLINNAGYVLLGAVEEITMEQARDIFETNFFGVVRMCQAVLPIMRRQGSGHIINITTMAGLNPVPYWGFYNASKAAVESLTEGLRHELKSLNISVSLVEPSFYKTNLGSNTQYGTNLLPDYEPTRRNAELRIREFHETRPAPDPVAEMILRIVQSDKKAKLRHMLGADVIYYKLRQWMPETSFESAVRSYWNLDKAKNNLDRTGKG